MTKAVPLYIHTLTLTHLEVGERIWVKPIFADEWPDKSVNIDKNELDNTSMSQTFSPST